VRLVQVVFALVLAQSLFLFRAVLTHPLRAENRVALLALAAVFTTTVLSWIDWHTTMVYSPYDTHHRSEKVRLFADLLVVVIYAYLLFAVEPLVGHPGVSLQRYLLGYPLVFFAYLVSGVTRRRNYGVTASRLKPIGVFLGVYGSVSLYYWDARSIHELTGGDWVPILNLVTLTLVLTLMIGYRLYRGRYRDHQRAQKEAGLVVGVDVDGVLADQITGVLRRLRERDGIKLAYTDIKHWRLPVGSSDIAKEIELAQQDRQYVLRMRTHPGARRLLHFLYEHNRVMVVTARADQSREWTREWLNRNRLWYDDLETSTEAKKSLHGTKVLVDDYLGNVMEFLENTHGVAVLVDQPWNRERDALQPFLEQGRALIVKNLSEIKPRWPTIVAAARRGSGSAA